MAKNILVVLSLFAATIVTFVVEITAATTRPNGHIGFIGVKGKRETKKYNAESASLVQEPTTSSIEATNLIENETNGIVGGNNDIFLRNLPELSIFKRAPPNGFVGSRGKKDFEYSDFSNGPPDEFEPEYRGKKLFLQGINRGAFYNGLSPKRTPSGFMGMRGKKKANAAFYGVRGKKDSSQTLDNLYEQLENLLEDSSSPYDEFHPESNQIYETDFTTNDQEKRGQKNNFFGVRGKRYPYGLVPHFDNYEKRVPVGFMGMRGRRSFDDDDNGNFQLAEKRKPAGNSFVGVRGKKDVSKQLEQNHEEKRASLASFFGVRGEKRLLNPGFFGSRGKKQPYEFRGKFVGVRGKKAMSDDSSNSLESHLSEIQFDSNSLEANNEKRTPNGFVGSRGKKNVNLEAN